MKTPIEILKAQKATGYEPFFKRFAERNESDTQALKAMLESTFPASADAPDQLNEANGELFRYLDRLRPLFQQLLALSKRSTSSGQLLEDLKEAMDSKDMSEIELQLLRAIVFTRWDIGDTN